MRKEVGVILTGGVLALAGCGGSGHVVTKTVTLTRPATVSTRAATTPSATTPNAGATPNTSAAGAFASTAIAADAELAAIPVGDAVFGPAELAATGAMTSSATATGTAPAPPKNHVVAGQASGEYAVADTNGTFHHHPSQIVLNISASPAQPGSVFWNVVCFEDAGGVGREAGHETLQLPIIKTLSIPAPSTECIASANVQLSRSGSVTISLSG